MTKQQYTEKIITIASQLIGHGYNDALFGMKEPSKECKRIAFDEANQILSLIPDLVRSLLPEKGEDGLRLDTFKEGYKCGFNKCLDQIEDRLKTWESEGK